MALSTKNLQGMVEGQKIGIFAFLTAAYMLSTPASSIYLHYLHMSNNYRQA